MSAIGRWGRGLILLAGLGWVVSGCSGTSESKTAHKDSHPLPADTMTYAAPEIGTYGGRFVIGQTASPKTFNAMMANETSSTDVKRRRGKDWTVLLDAVA